MLEVTVELLDSVARQESVMRDGTVYKDLSLHDLLGLVNLRDRLTAHALWVQEWVASVRKERTAPRGLLCLLHVPVDDTVQ